MKGKNCWRAIREIQQKKGELIAEIMGFQKLKVKLA